MQAIQYTRRHRILSTRRTDSCAGPAWNKLFGSPAQFGNYLVAKEAEMDDLTTRSAPGWPSTGRITQNR